MTRSALLVAIPLQGHLHPLIMQAAELRARGWDVTVATHTEALASVAARPEKIPAVSLGPLDGEGGISWEALEAEVTREPSFIRSSTRIMGWLTQRWTRTYDGMLQALETVKPDIVVADLATVGAQDAAVSARIPVVLNNADLLCMLSVAVLPPVNDLPAFFSGRSRHDVRWIDRTLAPVVRALGIAGASATLGRQLNAQRALRRLPPVNIHTRMAGRPTLVNTAFPLEYPRPLPPWVHLVGPMLPDAAPPLDEETSAWLQSGPPVIYASLGTVARAGPELLAPLLQGLRSRHFRILWSSRHPLPAALDVPSNVRIVPFTPSALGVMQHPNVRGVLSHCGINTAHESVASEKPVVGLPLFADQQEMALRLVDAGVGVMLDKQKLDPHAVNAAVTRVIEDETLRAPLAALRVALLAAGGVRAAVDIIESAASAEAA